MKFAVLSDTHYMSEKMFCPGASEEARLKNKISRAVFRQLAETDAVDAVLITGDLTHAGDRASHDEYVSMLREVQRSGKQVLALTATHDFQFGRPWAMKEGWPVRYRTQPWHKPWFDKEGYDYKRIAKPDAAGQPPAEVVPPLVKTYGPEALWDVYRAFGRDQAFSEFAPGYSYCVKLEEKTWVLMLNNNHRDIDPMGNMSPSYSPACLRWIEDMLRQAKDAGAFVFACTHHPLVPPVPAYKIGGTDRNMRRAYVGHMLADLGIPLVFSGHTHFADVSFAVSDKGSVLCDITTPGLASLPPMYRIVELDGAKGEISLTAVPVEKEPSFGVPDATMRDYYERRFIAEYSEKVDALPAGLGKCVKGLKVKHLYPLCRHAAGLSAAEYEAIRETHIFDVIMQCVVNMQCGDGQYTPDTPMYRFMMGLSAVLDSVIDAEPFVDVRKKLQGYSIREIVEPMLFNNFVPDNEARFDFRVLPEQKVAPAVFKSYAGEILMALLSVFAIAVSPLSPAVTCAALPLLTLRKKRQLRRNPPRPERY